MPNSVTGKFNNIVGSNDFQKEVNMSTRRKTHSQHTKNLLFKECKPSGRKDIRLDRASRMIKKQSHGIKEDPMGWNIHHVDGDWGNNNIINLEAVNYATHKEIHDED